MRYVSPLFLLLALLATPAFANVLVTSPGNGDTVTSPAQFVATANTTTCSKGVAAMGVYIDNQLVYTVDGTSLNTSLSLADGTHQAVIQEWDYCGGATTTDVPITVTSQSGIWITSPSNNSTVSGLVGYVATATSGCSQGVNAMGIYVDNQLVYVGPGSKLNTQINLTPGSHRTVVQQWDNCGGSTANNVNVTAVGNTNTFTNLQASNWNSWGQYAPNYTDCTAPCSGITWSMLQGQKDISLTGNSTKFTIGGTTPYSDVLWENPIIGQFSTQGLPDTDRTLVPSLHNFTYDAWFYLVNPDTTQAEEFDVNWFMNGIGMTWGTECRIEGGNEWDIWDNANAKWVATGIPCKPNTSGWNHVTINVQRTADNNLRYESITLNGVTANLNVTYPPFTVPQSWYGITVNYQMDGDHNQNTATAYVDKFNFMYW